MIIFLFFYRMIFDEVSDSLVPLNHWKTIVVVSIKILNKIFYLMISTNDKSLFFVHTLIIFCLSNSLSYVQQIWFFQKKKIPFWQKKNIRNIKTSTKQKGSKRLGCYSVYMFFNYILLFYCPYPQTFSLPWYQTT